MHRYNLWLAGAVSIAWAVSVPTSYGQEPIPLPMGTATAGDFCGSGCATCGVDGGWAQPVGQPCGTCGATGPCHCLANAVRVGVRPLKSYLGPGSECGCRRQITGVDSATCVGGGEPDWGMRGPLPWDLFAQGEYIGPARARHVDLYRLRVDDEIQFVYRVTRQRTAQAYKLNVGDAIRVESVADERLDRELVIQPDGTITLRLIGNVIAAGRTTDELRRDLEKRYQSMYREPAITVTPIRVNTKLEDLRSTVDSRAGNGGQSFTSQIIPDGTVQLPAIGSVTAHGLTLDELTWEINARYASIVQGIEVTPVLIQRAPRQIYVLGEVTQPGRFDLTAPTTVMGAIALAQGWNNGANLRNIVIFRRAEDWRLLATKVDVRGALYGRRPAPSDEIWLRDSDIVVVPKMPIQVVDDAIELIFTRGIYAVAPLFQDGSLFTDVSSF